jgi:hypothetical protein
MKRFQFPILVLVITFSLFNLTNLYSANAIYNGESAVGEPLVSTTYGNGGCSVAVIAPRILAMAQHCPATIGDTKYTYPGDDFISQKTGKVGIALTKFIPSGNFLGGREYDIMLVVIDQDFPVSKNLKIATESDISRWKSNKTEIATYGFGENGTGARSETPLKGRFYISPNPDLGNGISPSYTTVLSLNPVNNNSEICNGDSGGPSYVFENDNTYYLGATISSNGMNGCGKTGKLPIARVQTLYPFIDLLTQANDWVDKNIPKPVVVQTKTIVCKKGKLIKKVTDVNPKCPKGYKISK